MNIKEIKELIILMNENGLYELEIEREGVKIRIKKSPSGGFESISEDAGTCHGTQALKSNLQPNKEQKIETNLKAITAPMVGTFYRSPGPDTKSYVEIGKTIEVGETVCIIEAMKLMNEIKSEIKGKLVEVLVENATSVEYGQPLFVVEPM